MSSLQLTFPDEWATLPTGAGAAEAVRPIVLATRELDPAAGDAAERFFTGLLEALRDRGVDGFASLALPDEQSGSLLQAFCAVGVLPAVWGGEAGLRDVAEGGPHPGLERDTTTVELPLGTAVRSSAIRFAEELLDEQGLAPYAFEVRYAFALDGGRIGVLHFETLSLVYLEQLGNLFDAIAGTAHVA